MRDVSGRERRAAPFFFWGAARSTSRSEEESGMHPGDVCRWSRG